MTRIIRHIWLVLLLALVVIGVTSHASISITLVSDGWLEIIDKSDLIAGAGTDLISTYESTSDQVSINISGTTSGEDNWRVDVKRVDTDWHNDLSLYAQRTSNGSGGGTISGGSQYMAVTTGDQTFFSGRGDRTGIEVQLKVSGVSIQIPPGTYTTTLYYTVVDTL